MGGQDGVLKVFRYPNFEILKVFQNGHTADILDISWQGESYILTSGGDSLVIIWSLQSNGPIQKLLHQDIVSSAVFTSQNLVASGCFDRVIRLWNVN